MAQRDSDGQQNSAADTGRRDQTSQETGLAVTGGFDCDFRILTGNAPFPWQQRLFHQWLSKGLLPSAVDIPTGLGKTDVMVVWLLARAIGADLPRRLVYVVDRRAVVDQATDRAEVLQEKLRDDPLLGPVRRGLGLDDRQLPISTLRGRHVDNRAWLADPAAPGIIVGTVDMVGSRLLFSGYGVSRKMRPYHAGLLGADALIVLDEAHLVPPFERLLRTVEAGRMPMEGTGSPRADNFAGPAVGPALPPPFRILPLSATLGRGAPGQPLRLSAADRAHPIVRQRLEAVKQLTLEPLGRSETLVDVLVERAWGLAEDARVRAGVASRILIYCDRRDVAEQAATELQKRGENTEPQPEVILFVGGRRVQERKQAAEDLWRHGLIVAGADGERTATVFVAATAAGEVGVDLDADHMVCDLVSWERMVQRLGRVNRLGGRNARVLVIDQGPKEAGDRRHKAVTDLVAALPQAADNPEAYQAGPGALERLTQTPTGQQRVADASTPPPLYPATSRALIDAWSLTSLAEHPGRPEVGPWLRGWTKDDSHTTVIWRRCLPFCFEAGADTPRGPWKKDVEAFFEAVPPHAAELLETESWRVADWLKKRAGRVLKKLDTGAGERARRQSSDGGAEPRSSGTPEGYELLRPLTRQTPVAILLGSDGRVQRALRLEEAAVLRGRDLDTLRRDMAERWLVVDARLGGLTAGLLDPGRDDHREDPLPTIEDNWGRPEGWVEAAGGAADGGDTSPMRVRPMTDEARRRQLGEYADAGQSDDAWQEVLAVPYALSPEGDSTVWLVAERRGNAAAGDENRAVARTLQRLDEHQAWAAVEAGRIADALGLEPDDRTMLMAAARRHDTGKRAKRWQRAFNARHEGGPYAKTPGPVNWADLNGYRHEFQSVLDAQRDGLGELKRDGLRFDLALHLIAAHHGYARPTISVEGCDALRPTAAESRAVEIARRFARLQRQWGPWGLAWWEALLRAADQGASRALDEAAAQQRKTARTGSETAGTAEARPAGLKRQVAFGSDAEECAN